MVQQLIFVQSIDFVLYKQGFGRFQTVEGRLKKQNV